jgi:hypothetical protein
MKRLERVAEAGSATMMSAQGHSLVALASTSGARMADNMYDDFQSEPFRKWFFGLVVAIVLAGYGISVMSTGHATITTRRGILSRSTIQLDGFDATLFGWCVLFAAATLHCAFIWRNHDRYWRQGEIAFAITGLTWAVLFIWLLGRQFVNLV